MFVFVLILNLKLVLCGIKFFEGNLEYGIDKKDVLVEVVIVVVVLVYV